MPGQPSCQGLHELSRRYSMGQRLNVVSPGRRGLARISLGIRAILLGNFI